MLLQSGGKVGNQASAPVSSPAPQPSSAPSAAPTTKQAAQQPQPEPRATPATPLASVVREPDMKTIRAGIFRMGSNDDVTQKPTHQGTIKPIAMSLYPISVRDWNEWPAAQST